MNILVLSDIDPKEITSILEQHGCTITTAPLQSPPSVDPGSKIIIVDSHENTPPSSINPDEQSVLFIDTSYVEHPLNCYAFSMQWIADLLPIALFLFEQDEKKEGDQEIEKLFRDYRRTLFTKLQFIIDYFNQAVNAPTKELLELLKHHVHKTAGSAGTYGYPKVSQICKTLEGELIAFIERFDESDQKPYPQEKKEEYLKQIFAACIETEEKSPPPSQDAPNQTQSNQTPPSAEPPKEQEGIDLFLVDDDQELLALIGAEAKKRGITFEGESSFAKAKERITNPSFTTKLALFDIHSPNEQITGFELIDAFLQSRKESLTTTIAILSERAELPERAQANNLGIDLYFEKPIDIGFLFEQVQNQLKDRGEKKARILIVDDDTEYSSMALQSLEKSGFTCTSILSGDQLLQTIQEFKPELLLLDINLPNQNGIELLRALRTDFRYRKIQVIMVTASNNIEDVKKCYAAGAREFLSKPIDFLQLPSQIQNFLRKDESLQHAYARDPDFGLYTQGALEGFFTSFLFRYNSFCILFFYIVKPDGSKLQYDRDLYGKLAQKLKHFFNTGDVIGIYEDTFTLLLLDYTLDQALVMIESLHEFLRNDAETILGENGVITVAAHTPQDGNSMEEIFSKSNQLYTEKNEKPVWSIYSTLENVPLQRDNIIFSVVLISSDSQILTILSNAFEFRNITVQSYETGVEGYNYLLKHFFHDRNSAIILDGDFEKENGYVLLQKIKTVVGEKTPLYFLSFLSKEEDLTEGLNLGATRIFSKPIQLQVLLDTLEKDVRRR